MSTNVLLVEDNRLLRESLAAKFSATARFGTVDCCSTSELTQKASELHPDLVLLPLGERNINASLLVKHLRDNYSSTQIVGMDLVPGQGDVVGFIKAGVCGFILKDATFEDCMETISKVMSGQKVIPPQLTETLFSQIGNLAMSSVRENRAFDSARMTRREQEIVELIAEGLANKEIADRLNIAVHTVKSHVHNILEKLALDSRLQIVTYVHRERAGMKKPSEARPLTAADRTSEVKSNGSLSSYFRNSWDV